MLSTPDYPVSLRNFRAKFPQSQVGGAIASGDVPFICYSFEGETKLSDSGAIAFLMRSETTKISSVVSRLIFLLIVYSAYAPYPAMLGL